MARGLADSKSVTIASPSRWHVLPSALTNRCQMIGNCLTSVSLNRFERERNSLSATDAQRDNSALNPIALH